jgi:ParB/RepB/Spo0J family partition protein
MPNVHDIPVERIFLQDRQRDDLGDIQSLQFSIEQYGLLQPIVVEPRPEEKFLLIAGGRRLTAFRALGRKTIPAMLTTELDELTRKELEYEENIQRKSLTWLEECKAIAEIHRIKKIQFANNFPERFGRVWSQKDTAKTLQISEGKVSQDCALAEALTIHPEISKANTQKDALRLLRHLQENIVPDESLYQKKLRDCFILADFPDCAERLTPNSIDCIITDITGFDYAVALTAIHNKLTYCGNAWIFLPFEHLAQVHEILVKLGLPFRKRPYIWHVRGEDNYQTYLWFSRVCAEPPKAIPVPEP